MDQNYFSSTAESEIDEADFCVWQNKVTGTNISRATLLATDYLNHFNEIVMLIEMIPDMPDMIEECFAWQFKDYKQHFIESGVADRDLAILAYDHVPVRYRRPFDETINQMNLVVVSALARIADVAAGGNSDNLRVVCKFSVEILQDLVQVALSIIHGSERVMQQEQIDDYLAQL